MPNLNNAIDTTAKAVQAKTPEALVSFDSWFRWTTEYGLGYVLVVSLCFAFVVFFIIPTLRRVANSLDPKNTEETNKRIIDLQRDIADIEAICRRIELGYADYLPNAKCSQIFREVIGGTRWELITFTLTLIHELDTNDDLGVQIREKVNSRIDDDHSTLQNFYSINGTPIGAYLKREELKKRYVELITQAVDKKFKAQSVKDAFDNIVVSVVNAFDNLINNHTRPDQ